MGGARVRGRSERKGWSANIFFHTCGVSSMTRLKYPHELREELWGIQSDRGSTCMLSSDLMVVATPPSEFREDSMHAMSLLEKWLQRNAVVGHRGRVQALVRVVGALLDGGKLALTHLGRHRRGDAFVKHHIKAVDRLLGTCRQGGTLVVR